LGVNPDNARAWNRLALLHLKLGEHEEAEEACNKAINLVSHHASWITLASIRLAQRRYEEAGQACRNAIKQDGSRSFYWIRLATIENALGNHDQAIGASLK